MPHDPSSTTPSDECKWERLDALLDDSLGQQEESQLIAHLEHCHVCRQELDSRAAEPATWGDAERFLTDEPYDEFSVSRMEGERPGDPVSAQIQSVLQVLDPTDHPNSLGRLGPYEITGVIGCGGMGIVLKGMDPSLDRIVAIKVLAPHLASSGAARQRFGREAKAAAAVLHPNVIAIHSVANDVALPYLVMPYLRGQSLQRRIDQDGPLDPVDVLRIGVQVASGLAAAHAHGLVHRDIKPANILLEDGVERVTITDFGLARAVDDASMTRSGVIAGTPQYMSPEQARGEALDGRSDLFSLGSAMYTMCTGHSPFRAESSYGVLRRITDQDPRPIREINPSIPSWLCRLISRLQAKDRGDRFSSAEDLELVCRSCLTHLEQPDAQSIPDCLRDETPAGRTWKRPIAIGMLTLLAVVAVVNGPAWVDSWRRPAEGGKEAMGQVESGSDSVGIVSAVDPSTAGAEADRESGLATLPQQSLGESGTSDYAILEIESSEVSRWDDEVDASLHELETSLKRLDADSRSMFEQGERSKRGTNMSSAATLDEPATLPDEPSATSDGTLADPGEPTTQSDKPVGVDEGKPTQAAKREE